jgi:hypothetical protein
LTIVVTVPLSSCFCLLPIVCRAARVAARFAAAAAFCSIVSGVGAFLGLMPKSARTSGESPRVAFTNVVYADMKLRNGAAWALSWAIFALVAAFASSTAVRRSASV